MNPQVIIIFGSIAGFLIFLFLGVRSFFTPRTSDAVGRVTRIRGGVAGLDAPPEWQGRIAAYEAQQKGDLKAVVGRFTGNTYLDRLEKKLVQADMPMRVSEFVLLRLVLVVLPILAFGILLKSPVAAIAAAVTGLLVPGWWVRNRTKARVAKFNVQLADFLVLVVNALRSGQTFLQGVSHAVKECPDPINREFKQLLQETNLGMPIESAMQNLMLRVPSDDLQITCTGFLIQKNVGGNLADVLDKVAATIRERVKLAGMIKVLTAQGMLSGLIVGLLPFFVGGMIYAINNPYMEVFFTTTIGKIVMGGAIFLEVVGALIIKKIVTIEI